MSSSGSSFRSKSLWETGLNGMICGSGEVLTVSLSALGLALCAAFVALVAVVALLLAVAVLDCAAVALVVALRLGLALSAGAVLVVVVLLSGALLRRPRNTASHGSNTRQM